MKYFKDDLTSITVFLEILKKKKEKKSSEKKKALKMTSQLVIFRAFIFIFFPPPDPRSEKKIPVNQLIKKILALQLSSSCSVFRRARNALQKALLSIHVRPFYLEFNTVKI